MYTAVRQYKSIRVAIVEPVVPIDAYIKTDPSAPIDPKEDTAVTDTLDENSRVDYKKMEIICPDVVLPGTYFNCTADIPQGQGLRAIIQLKDDLTNQTNSSIVRIPGKLCCYHYVLGSLRLSS